MIRSTLKSVTRNKRNGTKTTATVTRTHNDEPKATFNPDTKIFSINGQTIDLKDLERLRDLEADTKMQKKLLLLATARRAAMFEATAARSIIVDLEELIPENIRHETNRDSLVAQLNDACVTLENYHNTMVQRVNLTTYINDIGAYVSSIYGAIGDLQRIKMMGLAFLFDN